MYISWLTYRCNIAGESNEITPLVPEFRKTEIEPVLEPVTLATAKSGLPSPSKLPEQTPDGDIDDKVMPDANEFAVKFASPVNVIPQGRDDVALKESIVTDTR